MPRRSLQELLNIKKEKPKNPTCGDCAYGEVLYHTLTVQKGEPILKSCPFDKYYRLLSEKSCINNFKKK